MAMHAVFTGLCILLMAGQAGAADTTTIAFGSCLRQWKPAPILDTVRALQPDAFIFAGDNVYTDTGPYRLQQEPGRIASAYGELAAKPEFQALQGSVKLFATWDDHDYGRDNAGAEYRWKTASKAEFLKFFAASDAPQIRKHPGIYSAHYIGGADDRIQILLLDTRTFRGGLREGEPDAQCPRSRLVATTDASATLLGEQQWTWLEDQLRQPAALRLIVSSIQLIPDQHCYEKWGNFPHERERLVKLIHDTGAARTVVLSGDRHLGEISALPPSKDAFPLYEITASGLNSAGAGRGEINRYRVTDDNVRVDHFGVVRYRRETPPSVELALYDIDGEVLQQYIIDYAAWQPRAPVGPRASKAATGLHR